MTKATLFLIPTPLGDVSMSHAVLPVQWPQIQHLQHFVVETPKVARRHLKTLDLTTPLQQLTLAVLNEHTSDADVVALLEPLRQGHDVGVMSDAGCPGVADPGARLVRLAHRHGYRVVPLIGASSILLALMASGSDGQRFMFHGYLPAETAARHDALKHLEQRSRRDAAVQLWIETPYRNVAMLESALQVLSPETWLSVACDLSLDTETIVSRPVRLWSRDAIDAHRRPAIFSLDARVR